MKEEEEGLWDPCSITASSCTLILMRVRVVMPVAAVFIVVKVVAAGAQLSQSTIQRRR
jgi:hypothetical protein